MLIHMDNFSTYGVNTALLTQGLYAAMQVHPTLGLALDPDGSPGRVLRLGSLDNIRYAFPGGATPTAGIAWRGWATALPDNARGMTASCFIRGAGNEALAYFGITSNGRGRMIVMNAANTEVQWETAAPVVTANGWWHYEIKYTRTGANTADFEVRIEGQTVLQQVGVSCRAFDPGQITMAVFNDGAQLGSEWLLKDYVLWNGVGAQNNNFLGSVLVVDLLPTTDVSLNWAKSSALFSGSQLIRDLVPFNILTASGAITSGNQVRINNTYYNWTNGSVNAGAPAGTSANPWLVAMGASTADALGNMFKAINASGVAGTDYSTALVVNPVVGATGVSATQLGVVALDNTSLYVCTETGANTAWAAGALFAGVNDMSFISANDTPPAAFVCELSNLPPDVTSVRGLQTRVRAAKTDGGDGSLQVSLVSGGVSADGANRPITTSLTYWPDICEIDPNTGALFTPLAVDAVQLKANRTT